MKRARPILINNKVVLDMKCQFINACNKNYIKYALPYKTGNHLTNVAIIDKTAQHINCMHSSDCNKINLLQVSGS